MPLRNPQKGSALFIILVGVMLFAALSYTVAQMMRGGNVSIISEEKARLFADEVLNYARALRQSVQNVKINGCSEMNISFENVVLTGYEHTPVVTDNCKVFHEAGGAVNYLTPAADWLDMRYTPAPPLRGQWYFPANTCVPGTGSALANCQSDSTDNEALVAVLPFMRKEVCVAINNIVGVTNIGNSPPPVAYTGVAAPPKFTGTLADGTSIDTGSKMSGCFEGDGGSVPTGTYHFYQVLLPR